MIEPEAIDPDAELESRIAETARLIYAAPTSDERLAAWEVLKDLIAQRSPARVAEMEAERGLR